MVAESWFRGLWKSSKKHDLGQEKVFAFEVASLLSKLVHQWNSLTDKQVMKLREISNSVGIKRLVSDDDNYLVDLICAEMLHNLENVARVVTRLAKKCSDPLLKCFEHAYDDLIKLGVDQYNWQFTWKKMDKKVKKMEKFVFVNANLYQEMETLTELEQILRRMKSNDYQDSITLVEHMKKLAWQQQEVKWLKEISLWNRTHDYVVLLLARSIFTIFNRIGHVCIPLLTDYSDFLDSDHIYRSQSVSALLQSYIHPSENGSPVKNCHINPNAACVTTPHRIEDSEVELRTVSSSKQNIFDAPPETLGAAALALHYANVVIVLEKLLASPHLISHDARDDLYNMLPKTVRSALRVRLKPYTKSLASSDYDRDLAEEWSEAISAILEWLSPLAHSMIQWQSERSFEQQNLVSKTNVLLVQTLHYANQEKTEATITELLVGLNYIWRFGREVNAKAVGM
ncbi:uncharacterized protein LOC112509972 isoform X2 [Cynara cardunculus var. scolymus]|nr:uncharacterized protein LOC112509972 isoform X2 [Cynara cardunculus var. scolymus]